MFNRTIYFIFSLLTTMALAADKSVLLSDIKLPDGFETHFFGTPLMVKVTVDGKVLGDGEIILSKDNTVRLVSIFSTDDEKYDDFERQVWLKNLDNPIKLNNCEPSCPKGVVSVHYSLEESLLAILTGSVEFSGKEQRFINVPRDTNGLIVTNQLNLASSDQTSAHHNIKVEGSIGAWSTYIEGDSTWQEYGDTQTGLAQLYGEQLVDNQFYRVGFFFPSTQGLIRQPNYATTATPTILGVMWGSSDLLRRESGVASMTPIQVTPARNGFVEIYRDGTLILSVPVSPGLQALDTKMLPSGIYEVELRLLEDGRESRRWRETIYKPNNWQTPEEPWRFNFFAGRQTKWLTRSGDSELEGVSAGIGINRLLLPNLVVGAGSQYVEQMAQQSLSLDWGVTEGLHIFSSLNQSAKLGWNYDIQAVYGINSSSIVVSHARALSKQAEERALSSLSLRKTLDNWGSLGANISHQSDIGNGIDIGWNYSNKLWGSWVTWGVTMYNRPSVNTDSRDHGAFLNLTINLNDLGKDRQLSFGIGSDASNARRSTNNGYLNYQQSVDWGPLNQIGAGAVFDSSGVGLSGRSSLDASWLNGDAFVQQLTNGNKVTGGLNLNSMLVAGDNRVVFGSNKLMLDSAAIILDVEAVDTDTHVLLSDDRGMIKKLTPGRHFIPVPALQRGSLNFEMSDYEHMPLAIYPSTIPYNLNRGGVAYHKVQAIQTVTVIGRILDKQGLPLQGATISNSIGRAYSEPDGFFTLETSRSNTQFEVDYHGAFLCEQDNQNMLVKSSNAQVINIGDFVCTPIQTVSN